jgi:2-hydroxymuconate-semialdehyde hydrolase
MGMTMRTFDESDLSFEETTMHVWHGGSGFPLILLHGSGAGVGTLSNFQRVLEPLAEHFEVIAADLIGYGKSGLRRVEPYFDMSMWVNQVHALTKHYCAGRHFGLIGHSLAGSIVLKAAVGNAMVAGVVTTATTGVALGPGKGPQWKFPADREDIRRHIGKTMYDSTLIDLDEIPRRCAVLYRPGYKDYFEKMFSEPGHVYMERSALTDEELAQITCPVLLMHGANDLSYTFEQTTLPLTRRLNQGDAHLLARCGHSVAHEHPAKVVSSVLALFGKS